MRIAANVRGLSPDALLGGGRMVVHAHAQISADQPSLQGARFGPLHLVVTAVGDTMAGKLRSLTFALQGQGGMEEKTVDRLLALLPPIAHERRIVSALSGMMRSFRIDIPHAQLAVSDARSLEASMQ